MPVNRVVEVDQAIGDQLHDQHCGERLGDRPDAVLRCGCCLFAVRMAVDVPSCCGPDEFATAQHPCRRRRDPARALSLGQMSGQVRGGRFGELHPGIIPGTSGVLDESVNCAREVGGSADGRERMGTQEINTRMPGDHAMGAKRGRRGGRGFFGSGVSVPSTAM